MVKLGVIGTGAWGSNLLRNFAHARGAEVKLCCDLDTEKGMNAVNSFTGIEFTRDPEAMFSDPGIDAVVIATSSSTHFDLSRRAIQAGKDVFVEKPMSLSLKDAVELTELAEASDRILMVGHLLEYHPAVEKIRELVESGELGDPYYIYSQRVNLGKIRSDENALWSFAPHDISIILYLLQEEPVEVAATGAAYIQKGIEDVVFLWMRFPGDKLAQVHVSWLDPHKIRRTTIVGSKKMVVFDDMEPAEKIRIYDKGVNGSGRFVSYSQSLSLHFGDVTIPALKMSEPLSIECRHFLDCVESRTQPKSNGRDGVRVVRVLEAAQRSLEAGGGSISL